LGLGEEVFNGLVGLAELGAVTLVEDEDHALIAKRFEALFKGGPAVLFTGFVVSAGFVEGEAEFLDGGDDDLVCVVVGDKAADKCGGVSVFFDAAFLEAVELLAGLSVEVFSVDDEETLVDVGVEF